MSETRHDADFQGVQMDLNLELLAIEQQFVAEYEAGAAPRLATCVLRYPEHAEALTTFVAEYLTPSGGVAEEEAGEEVETRRPLGTGTRRALDAIFGAQEKERRVAEQPETYSVDDGKGEAE